MTSTVRNLLIVFVLMGLASSVTSTYVHYQILKQPGYSSFCDVNTTVSCTEVYKSRYSTLGGVPVAIGGVFWFTLILVLVVGSARASESSKESIPGYVFALATLALGVVLYLGYTSIFVLKTICMMCVVTYAAVIAIFVISGARTPFPMMTLPRRAMRDLQALAASPLALMVAVLFIAGAASAVAFFPREGIQAPAPKNEQDLRSDFERYFESLPRQQVPVPSNGAAVTIVKFHDYQCPACASTYFESRGVFNKMRVDHPGAINFVTKDFPLEPECNPNVPNQIHAAACEAAVAVRLAKVHGKGEQMEEWLFTNQQSLSPSVVRQAARDIGGVPDFDAQYARTIDQVKSDVALARLLNIRVTPTFFINGARQEGGLPTEYFEQAIELELKKAKK